MKPIKRYLHNGVESKLFKGKTIIITGARRVGKTHFCNQLVDKYDGLYYNCDLQEVRDLLDSESKSVLYNLTAGKKLVIFDEAQGVPFIGKKLKILHDSFPEIQFVATGSSSFDLVNKTSEPLTGRSRVFKMHPLSMGELVDNYGLADAHSSLSNMLIYGGYPEVYLSEGNDKIEELENISSNYLYRDMLQLGDLKKPELILDILKLLAFQIGGEVSLNKIANTTHTSVHTVKSYIEMLEKSFVLYSLPGFSRNLRKEVGKSRKYYFIDLGIRNSVIRNFNPLNLRNDVGMLWENYCVIERLKKNAKNRQLTNNYFWRTYDQQEIDYIEEYGGTLKGYEFKYTSDKYKKPAIFLDTYEGSSLELVNRKNYLDFVL